MFVLYVFDIIPDVYVRNNIDDQKSGGKVTADSAGHGLGSLKTADSFIHKWPLSGFFFFSFGCTTAIEKKNKKERAL